MFGIGMTEMIIIAVIALIFIGPDQIPEVARNVGKLLNDLKRSTDDIKKDFTQQTGLPRNFDEWLEQRKTDPQNQIAPPAHEDNSPPASADHPLEDNHHEPVVVTGSNGLGHPPVDSEGQTSMNLDVESGGPTATDDSKDPKNS